MRALAAAATLSLAFALPQTALAQDVSTPLPEAQEDSSSVADDSMLAMADKLNDPAQQERMADMAEAFGELMLGLPVGQLVQAVPEEMRGDTGDIDRDATIRDLAGVDAERMPARISEQVPQMMGLLAGLLEGLYAMRPALAELGETMRERMDETREF